jgi:hypothetical protein
MFTALVITVIRPRFRKALATAVVVVPESKITHSPSRTKAAATSPMRCFSFGAVFLFPAGWVEQSARPHRQCSTMGALPQAFGVKILKVLADCYL